MVKTTGKSKATGKSKTAGKNKKSYAEDLTAKNFIDRLNKITSKAELKKHHKFFDFDENPKTKGDKFIGVRMGHIFELAKEFIPMPVKEIEKLLESPIHEARAGACSIIAKNGALKDISESRLKELYELYIRRHDRIDNWDLVDLAAHKVVGKYLFDYGKPRNILYKLARSKNTWERRSAIVSTFYFIFKGEADDTFKIAEILLNDKEPLMHKATGWALRATDAKFKKELLRFLDKYAATMPRAALRNTIEHFSRKEKEHYMGLKNN